MRAGLNLTGEVTKKIPRLEFADGSGGGDAAAAIVEETSTLTVGTLHLQAGPGDTVMPDLTQPELTPPDLVPGVRTRPRRADARRNYDALVAAAREAFAEHGTDAPLEEIARRAGVGIATLYRNFPTRSDLVESVYVDEVEAVCRAAATVAELPPWDALAGWLHRFADYVGTKHALIDGLNRDSATFPSCRESLYSAGGPLLARAQADGTARTDVGIGDVLRMVGGIMAVDYDGDGQRERVFAMALDGIRTLRT